jgi:glycosyltransferase involved in cell wall biosynthesis
MRTAFIVPAYNEEKGLPPLGEYVDFAAEIAVVDDGSADWTPEVGKKCVTTK